MSSPSHYSIRPVTPQDYGALASMMEAAFGIQVGEQFFQWKYSDNPAGPVRGFLAIAPDGSPAAYYGAIPQRYSVFGEEHTIFQSGDTMTHPAHRRKGLFEKLARHCYEDLRQKGELFVFGFGGDTSTPGFLKMGWRVVAPVPQLIFPRPFLWLPRFGGAGKNRVEEIDDLAQVYALAQKSNRHTAIHSVKSEAYFRWRLSNPLRHYRIFMSRDRESGEITGYLIWYEQKARLYILDGAMQDRAAERALLNRLGGELRSRPGGAGIVALCSRESSLWRPLRRAKFLRSPFRKGRFKAFLPLILFAPDEVLERCSEASFWNLTAYDHDTM